MTTLQDIKDNTLSLTRDEFKADRKLVIEVQTKLTNLGFYPGGGWIDGFLGNSNSFSWRGLIDFCNRVGGITIPSDSVAIDSSIAQKLLDTQQVNSILIDAANSSLILNKLQEIQQASPIVNKNTGTGSAFISRTIDKSHFKTFIERNYPLNVEQRPDGISVISYGSNFTLSTGRAVNFSNYPDRGVKPTIDNTGLDFLSPEMAISHACVCVGSFVSNSSAINSHWLGKNAFDTKEFYSTTKFIGVLNTVCKTNEISSDTDIDDCFIRSSDGRFSINDLVEDMVNYGERIASSNAIGAMFKRFSERPELQNWIRDITDNEDVNFLGGYGTPPYVLRPKIRDEVGNTILSSADLNSISGNNSVSAYDLVRLISMLGWNPHLSLNAKLPSDNGKSFVSILRAMGYDTARYVDIALETLGLINVISEPVIISKAGWGNSAMTYAAFVKFVDRRTSPGKLRTFALALRCPGSDSNSIETVFDFRDTRLAAAVTEIIRRIVTEELA